MILSQNQKKQLWTDGFLLVENAINDMQLENLKKKFTYIKKRQLNM